MYLATLYRPLFSQEPASPSSSSVAPTLAQCSQAVLLTAGDTIFTVSLGLATRRTEAPRRQ